MKLFGNERKDLFAGKLDNLHFFNVYYKIGPVKNVRSIYCKESFIRIMFMDDYRKVFLPDFTFFSTPNKIEQFIQAARVIHKRWNLPQFNFVTHTNDKGQVQIYVRNKFWRQNPAHLDFLATIFKLVATTSAKISVEDVEGEKLSALFVKASNRKTSPYLTDEVKMVLDFGPEFVKEYYGEEPDQYKSIERKMFSYSVNGLISSLRAILKNKRMAASV